MPCYSEQDPFPTRLYVNEVTFGKQLRVELVARGTNPVFGGLELAASPLTSGEGKGPEVVSVT